MSSLSDIDVSEAVEVENTTTAGVTNQTSTNGNMTEVELWSIQGNPYYSDYIYGCMSVEGNTVDDWESATD
jgi:hypothetical protein